METESFLKPILMDSEELAQWLFQIYLSMFDYEGQLYALINIKSSRILFDTTKFSFGISGRSLAGDMRYYSRTNLVILIGLIKTRVGTDWEACVSSLILKMKNEDSLFSSQNTYPEFLTRLHLLGLCRDQMLDDNPYSQKRTLQGRLRATEQESGVLQQSPCPQYVYVALVVPRECLKPFTDVSPETATTPRLYISVGSKGLFDHHFFGIDYFFGILKATPEVVGHCEVEEDSGGWHGCGDLIVSCLVPSWLLLMGSRSSTHVSLKVYESPTSISRYGARLGEEMMVFGCGLDNNRLWILNDIPGVLQDRPCLTDIPKLPSLWPRDSATPTVALEEDGTVKHIAIKLQFPIQAVESKMLKGLR